MSRIEEVVHSDVKVTCGTIQIQPPASISFIRGVNHPTLNPKWQFGRYQNVPGLSQRLESYGFRKQFNTSPAALLPLSSPSPLEHYSIQFIQSPKRLPPGPFSCLEDDHLYCLRGFLALFRVYLESPSASDRAPQPGTSGSPIACCAHRGRLQ